MKKIFAVLAVLAVLATLTGCGTTAKMIPVEGSGGRYSAISVTEKGFNGHDATIIALVEEGSQVMVQQAPPVHAPTPVATTPTKSSVVVKKSIKADSWRQKCPSPKQRYDIRHEDRTEITEETVTSAPPPPPAPAPASVTYKSQAKIVGMYGGGNESIGNSILKGVGAAAVGGAGYYMGQKAHRPDSMNVKATGTGGAGGTGGSASSSSSSSASASAAAAAAAAAAAE